MVGFDHLGSKFKNAAGDSAKRLNSRYL